MLALCSVAATGGAGPHFATLLLVKSPLAAGQVWELKAVQKDGLEASVQMRLYITKDSPTFYSDIQTYIYAAESALGGGNLNYLAKESGLDAALIIDKNNTLRCFAQFVQQADVANGYLLQGTVEGTNQQLREAQEGTNYTHAALIQDIGRLGMGTCTLRRVR